MNDAMAVKVTDSAGHLPEIVAGQIFFEVGFLTDLSKQATIGGKLQKKVDLILICKKAIHFENVWMI